MEDYIVNGESVSFGSSTKRKAEEMFESKDGDVHTSMANKGSKLEDENGAETKSSGEGEGMIKNLISTLFRPRDGENKKVDGEIEAESGSNKRVNDNSASEDGNENGGIIRSIVSHLTTALPEEAAPSTDEASILIHSIVHD